MPTEKVDLVNEKDEVVGTSTIKNALERGLLHRAVAVLVVRSDGRFLLQQRSRRDLWHPGLWTLSCTGHVREGETYAAAAVRELSEELGMTAELRRLKKYLMAPMSSGGLTEREWVTLYTTETDSPCVVDPVELEGVAEFDEAHLKEKMKGGSMTPDAVALLDDYLLARHEKR
jgi:isopentenyl-diphosphate delta-isomerase type 1